MPHLTFRGINKDELIAISTPLLDGLVNQIGCDRSHFTLGLENTLYVFDGYEATIDPIVEISWFDRGQSVRDSIAKLITAHIQDLGYSDVSIWFTALEKSAYYDNGEHY